MNKSQWIKLQTSLLVILAINLGTLSLNFATYQAIKDSTPQPIIEHKIHVVKQEPIELTPIEVVEAPVQIVKTQEEIISDYIYEVCSLYPNVDPAIVKSVIFHESRFDPKATNGKCIGLMQVSTYWHADRAARLGVTDFYDPYSNILLGVDYLSELINTSNSVPLALMLYNMKHADAYQMFKEGRISSYAKSVLAEAEIYKKGE